MRIPVVIQQLVEEITEAAEDPRFREREKDLLAAVEPTMNGIERDLLSCIQRDGASPDPPEDLELIRPFIEARH